MDRNGEWWRETVMPETVVKDGNVDGGDGVRNGVNWKGRSVGNGLSEILRDSLKGWC